MFTPLAVKSTPLRPFKYPPRFVDSSLLISFALTSSIEAGASVILSTLFFAVTVVVSTSNDDGSIYKSIVPLVLEIEANLVDGLSVYERKQFRDLLAKIEYRVNSLRMLYKF